MPISSDDTPGRLVAASPSTRKAFDLGRLYAPASSFLLLIGETGTGKTAFARWVHEQGARSGRDFVEATAMEFTDSMARSQLFGHERGAFTDAAQRHRGLFQRAADGTVLLDDLHFLPMALQAALLRVFSSGSFQPLGLDRDLPLLSRVIVGLRDCPDKLMRAGLLLPDLRYRLGHCIVRLAPLSERREEIAPLAQTFLRDCPWQTRASGPAQFAPDVMPALEAAPWPGNLRELRSVIEAAFLHADGGPLLRFDHLPEHVRIAPRFVPYGDVAANERAMDWALWRARNRVDHAARLIGAHRNTVSAHIARRRMKESAHNATDVIVPDDGSSASLGG
jgi:DNA-binding NtrC family response regulator